MIYKQPALHAAHDCGVCIHPHCLSSKKETARILLLLSLIGKLVASDVVNCKGNFFILLILKSATDF